jgi:hypothetical protein
MALTDTAQRMLETLPTYYWENPIIQRILQARANEIDRMDATVDLLKQGLVPTTADDELGLLSIWEIILDLPVAPPDATVAQRQAAVKAGFKRLSANTAADVLSLLQTQGGTGFAIARDTPALLEDTITIHYAEDTFQAAMILSLAQRAWPAHRLLVVAYDAGFAFDLSELDLDTL